MCNWCIIVHRITTIDLVSSLLTESVAGLYALMILVNINYVFTNIEYLFPCTDQQFPCIDQQFLCIDDNLVHF